MTSVLDVGQSSLAELASAANEHHRLALAAGVSMVEHAIVAGEALLQARQHCPRNEWMRWCEVNLDCGYSVVAQYMRIARYRDVLEGLEGGPPMSLTRARELLVGAGNSYERQEPGVSKRYKKVRETALKLLAEGMSKRAVADAVGVNPKTVAAWADPEAVQREHAAKRRRREELQKAQDALRAKEVKRAARKAGAAMSEAYALAERMQDVLGQAQRECSDREAREALSRAGVSYRRMRDEIVRALGIS